MEPCQSQVLGEGYDPNEKEWTKLICHLTETKKYFIFSDKTDKIARESGIPLNTNLQNTV